MSKRKHNSSLTNKEREIVRNMKHELEMMGVPRKEWAKYIQKEINFLRRSHEREGKEKKSGIIHWVKKLWEKIVGWFFKQTAKRYTQNEELLEEFYKIMEEPYEPTEDDKKLMEMFSPNVEFKNVDKLGEGGASLNEAEDKKRVLVDLDDDLE